MVGRKPNGKKARRDEPRANPVQAQSNGERQLKMHYDDDRAFYDDDEVDHAAVANAASKRPGKMNKFTSFMFIAFGTMGSLIAVNAAFLQDGKHPSPMMTTRTDQPQLDSSALVKTAQRVQRQELVGEIQRELRRLGVYPGSLDGQFGPATERAVRAYQRQRAIKETGLVTGGLLARLTMDFDAVEVSSLQTAQVTPNGDIPIPRATPGEIAALTQGKQLVAQKSDQQAATTVRIKKLQQTLASLGYGPLTVDGIPGGQTSSAIAAFQRENKLKVDGKMSEALISNLARISGTRI